MGAFFDLLPLEPQSRMTGVWTTRVPDFGGRGLHAFGQLIWLGEGQDPDVEWDFLGSHLPLHLAGVSGVDPNGRPWLFVIQLAPEVDPESNPSALMRNAMNRALEFNGGAWCHDELSLSLEDLRAIYAERGVESDDIAEWTVPELIFGLLAECCYVELPQIVAGRVTQCAFRDDEHECTHDVFTDVFSRWVTGALTPSEEDFDAYDQDDEDDDPRFTREELLEYSLSDLQDLLKEVGFRRKQIKAQGDDMNALASLCLSLYEPHESHDDDNWTVVWDEEEEEPVVRRISNSTTTRRWTKRELRRAKTLKLRLIAASQGCDVDKAIKWNRKKLLKRIATGSK